MDTKNNIDETSESTQSNLIIQKMIHASREVINSHGILFILWGWINFITFFTNYLSNKITFSYDLVQLERSGRIFLPLLGLVITLFYVIYHRKHTRSYINITLRYIWVSVFFCLVLTNLIQFNVLHQVYFSLQHPIFMLFISFAIVISGAVLRDQLITAGGVIFAALAFVSSYFPLEDQLLIEAIGWMIAFIIPGHITYYQRKKRSAALKSEN